MDYRLTESNSIDFYGDVQLEEDDLLYDEENGREIYSRSQGATGLPIRRVDGSSTVIELQNSVDEPSPLAGKLFVGGIAWETSQEYFNRYFSKYGEVLDSIIMMDKISGRPRGFGFVTFADPEVANRVLQEEHVIDGREVEVKRTVPREDSTFRRSSKSKKIFVGGLPATLCDDDLKEYFSSYGNVVEQQIMLDHTTGRSRGFGFVSFDSEDSVEKVLSDGRMHELNGKQVEIKRAEPKRADHMTENRMHHGNNNSASLNKGYGGFGGGYGVFGPYGNYVGGFGMGPMGFYGGGFGGYGYGYGFGGSMYGAAAAGFGGSYGFAGSYGYTAANMGSHGGAKGFGGDTEYDGVEVSGGGGDSGYGGGSAKGHGGGGGGGGGGKGNDGAGSGRFHPYRK